MEYASTQLPSTAQSYTRSLGTNQADTKGGYPLEPTHVRRLTRPSDQGYSSLLLFLGEFQLLWLRSRSCASSGINLQTRRQGTYSLDTAGIRLICRQQFRAVSRVAPLGEAPGLQLWPLLRRPGRGFGRKLQLGQMVSRVSPIVVVEVAAQRGAAEDSLDELVLAEGFGEIILIKSVWPKKRI